MDGTRGHKINTRYISVSKRYKTAKYVALLLLILSILYTLSFYREELTAENLRYLIKYFDASAPEYTGVYRTIYYSSSDVSQVGIYKGELATVSGTSADLYNMLGNNTLSYSVGLSSPVLLTGTRYMLVYSLGENSYTINNAFSKLHGETFDYPITGAAMSDSGMYAIITKNIEYRSAVYFYDRNFNTISRIFKDKFVMGAAISPDGTDAVIISAYAKDGGLVAELMSFDPYSDKADSTETLENTLPLTVAYNSTGGYSVCFDDRLRFYSKADKPLGEYLFDGRVPLTVEQGKECTVVTFSQNIVGNSTDVLIFGNDGALVKTAVQNGQITDIECGPDAVYLLFDASLTKIELPDEKSEGETYSVSLDGGCEHVLLKDEETLMICRTHRADAYPTDGLFAETGAAG